jgi:hypothetical protein
MKKTNIIFWVVFALTTLTVIESCKKKEFINPYGEYTSSPLYQEPALASVPSSNFAYLQTKVFSPTCANSGCHDGTFEPDFRTISSSYNSIVYHPVLTNDGSNTFTYRVQPGNADLSLIHERLLIALPNTSGIMPAITTLDWNANKTSYITSVRNWINNGALDMYGNVPDIGDPNPFVSGFHAFADGNTTTPYIRANGTGILPIVIPQGNVDLWFAINDNNTPTDSLTVNEIKISEQMYDGFDIIVPNTMTTTGTLTANNFENNSALYTHKYDFDASSYVSGTILYVRIYVQDSDHTTPLETPKEGSAKQIIYLFTLYVN